MNLRGLSLDKGENELKKNRMLTVVLALLLCMGLFAGCAHKPNAAETKITVTADTLAEFEYGTNLDDEGFFENVKASDYVTVPEYKGLTVGDDLTVADPDTVASETGYILEQYPTYETVDKAIEDGDTVNIDYVGKVDGVEFEGGSTQGMGTDVTIGVTSYIDDFLEQLIGHNAGETFDIEVTFPDEYENSPDLAGKDAVFTVTINSVYGEASYPTELTEEMALDSGFETVEELEAYISNWVLMSQKVQYVQELLTGVEIKKALPQSVVDYAASLSLMTYQYYADAMESDIDSVISTYSGGAYKDLASYLSENAEAIKQTAAYYLAMQAIAEKEGLKVTDEDLEASDYDAYMESYDAGYVKLVTLQDYVIPNFIFDHANVVPADQTTTTTTATTAAAE